MRVPRVAKYVLIAHQILLVLFALADLGAYVFLYLELSRLTLLIKFRVRLFLSNLPKDVRRSAYDIYESYVKTSLRIGSIRDLLSLVSRD